MKVVIKEGDKILAEIPIDKSKSFADQIVGAYMQGAREFAEWLKKSHWRIDLSEALSEWQKERI